MSTRHHFVDGKLTRRTSNMREPKEVASAITPSAGWHRTNDQCNPCCKRYASSEESSNQDNTLVKNTLGGE